MALALVLSVFAGMAIGLRSKILMLVPAILIATLTMVAIATVRGDQSSTAVGLSVLVAIAVQIGYLVGSLAIQMLKDPQPDAETAMHTKPVRQARSPLAARH